MMMGGMFLVRGYNTCPGQQAPIAVKEIEEISFNGQ
jgi:hypothetical protein